MREQRQIALFAFLKRRDRGMRIGNILHHAETRYQLAPVVEHALLEFTQLPGLAIAGDDPIIKHVRFARLENLPGVEVLSIVLAILRVHQFLKVPLALEDSLEFGMIDPVYVGHLIRVGDRLIGDLVPFPDAELEHFR